MQSTDVDRKMPPRGTSSRLSTFDQYLEPGMAPSRAKAYVHRLAAVRAPTPAKNMTPSMRNRSPKPPAADPVTVLNSKPSGWPLGTPSRVGMSGRTKRMGMRKKRPVMEAAATERTMALGTSRSGFCTSSHMAATMP